jgi:hypothetical protein
MSPWVRIYVPVKVVLSMAPGANVAIGPPTIVTNGSVTVTLVRVTLPVFSHHERIADRLASVGVAVIVRVVPNTRFRDRDVRVQRQQCYGWIVRIAVVVRVNVRWILWIVRNVRHRITVRVCARSSCYVYNLTRIDIGLRQYI